MINDIKLVDNAVDLNDRPFLKYSQELYDCLESDYPELKGKIGSIKLVDSADWVKIWNEKSANSVVEVVEKMANASSHNRNSEKLLFQKIMQDCRLSLDIPHSFLWRMEQMNPEQFPLMGVQGLWTYADPSLLKHHGATDKMLQLGTSFTEFPVNKLLTSRRRKFVKEWLRSLPLNEDELVYVALNPKETLVSPWELFCDYWDAFYNHSWCTVNVVDDDARWCLFMHSEEFAYFCCTEEYVKDKGNGYRPIFSAVDEMHNFSDFLKNEQSKATEKYIQDIKNSLEESKS